MYQYSINEKDTEEIQKLQNISSNINSKLQEIDNKYETTLNTNRDVTYNPPNFQKIEYVAPTEQQVKEKAENSLSEYKTSSIDAINQKYDDKISDIDEKVVTKQKMLSAEKQELEEIYGSLKQNASNEAQKRGLQRSSIIVNQLEAFDRDKLNQYLKLNNEFKTTFNQLTSEKEILNSQKNSALSSFDITYAIKLQDKIDAINNEIEKKEQEVLKYNNEILEKESEYQREYEDNMNKLLREDRIDTTNLLEYLSKYGTSALEELKAKEKYTIVENAIRDLTKEQALNEVRSNANIKSQLGRYYNKLIAEINAREK